MLRVLHQHCKTSPRVGLTARAHAELDSRKDDAVQAIYHEYSPRGVERVGPWDGEAGEGGHAAARTRVGGIGEEVGCDGSRLFGYAAEKEALQNPVDVLLWDTRSTSAVCP